MADKYLNSQGLSALRSWVLSKITESAGTGELASMFDVAMAEEYHVSNAADAPAVIANQLNLDGFDGRFGTSGITFKKPTVDVSSITWSQDVDENYDLTGTGTVRVYFGSAGSIAKTVRFKTPGEGKIYGVKGSNSSVAIDTGIAADYSYTFHVKGFGDTSTTVLMGAFISNSERTTFRILPSSGAAQQMWPNNQQYTGAQLGGITVTSLFEYWQKANSLRIVQGSIDSTITPSGNTDTGSVGANIFLLNEDGNSSRGYGTLIFAEILDSNSSQVAYFAPYKLHTGEVVIINTSGLTAQQIYECVELGDSATMASRILRPTGGTLIEVSSA